jgi:hypothetical protein
MSTVAAETGYRSETPSASYHHGEYSESDERMEVKVDQLSLSVPIGERFEAKLSLIRDLVSGASPFFNGRDRAGQPFQLLQSGASIRDTREVINASLGYYGDSHYLAARAGRSREDDYESDFASLEYRRDLNQGNTSLTASAAYEDDRLWNSAEGAGLLTGPARTHRRYKTDLLLGVGQLLDKNSLLQVNLTYSHSSGFLSDPYKKVYVARRDPLGLVPLLGSNLGGGALGGMAPVELAGVRSRPLHLVGIYDDSRPDSRDQWIALARYSRYLDGTDSALHLDYRLGLDDWGADSHTLEVKWNKDFGSGWSLSTGLRYYTQHSADFYRVSFDRLPGDRTLSSDYRLAGFGAVSARLGLAKTLLDGGLTLRIDYERYERRKALELNHSRGDDLDDFSADLISLTLESVF